MNCRANIQDKGLILPFSVSLCLGGGFCFYA